MALFGGLTAGVATSEPVVVALLMTTNDIGAAAFLCSLFMLIGIFPLDFAFDWKLLFNNIECEKLLERINKSLNIKRLENLLQQKYDKLG